VSDPVHPQHLLGQEHRHDRRPRCIHLDLSHEEVKRLEKHEQVPVSEEILPPDRET